MKIYIRKILKSEIVEGGGSLGGLGGDRERGSGMGSCRALESKEEGEREEGARKEQG